MAYCQWFRLSKLPDLEEEELEILIEILEVLDLMEETVVEEDAAVETTEEDTGVLDVMEDVFEAK